MLRKLMLPLVAAFALTGCGTVTGLDYFDEDKQEWVFSPLPEQPPAEDLEGGTQ